MCCNSLPAKLLTAACCVALLATCDPLVDRNSFGNVLTDSLQRADDVDARDNPPDISGLEVEDILDPDLSTPETEVIIPDVIPDDFEVPDDICTPDCNGKQCGPDGCGGSCGSCDIPCTLAPPWGEAQHINYLAIGNGGKPGEALDVDNDAQTCSPAGSCSGGLNNQLSGMVGQLAQFIDTNSELEQALETGDLMLLLEWVDYAEEDTDFLLRAHPVQAVEEQSECNWSTDKCQFEILADTIDPGTCKPYVEFDNARVVDGHLMAGGPDYIFTLRLPLSETTSILLKARMARLVGDLEEGAEGKILTNAVLGGAIPKADLMNAIDGIPPDAELPISKDMIKNLLDTFIMPDIDTDSDGQLDSASIGIKLAAHPAEITGFTGQTGLICSPDGQCLEP
jgi:hypothetical protein